MSVVSRTAPCQACCILEWWSAFFLHHSQRCVRMQGFFAKTLVVGMVAAGFYLTGDFDWLMDRAGSWTKTTGETPPPNNAVATAAAVPASSASPAAPPVPVAATRPPPSEPAAAATEATTTSYAGDASLPVEGVALPEMAHEQIVVATLQAGDRILARTTYEVVAYDLIDPSRGEAVEHRHALLAAQVATAAALTTPRRVVLPARLSLGQPAAFTAVIGSPDTGPPPVGNIVALGMERPLD